ncbi:Blp family class II bacteriocin [Streptococcus equinus]|nr:Blp family class II bacteriocin [Streptococcus equinus]SDJ30049.1 bacteriocin-type signal sequence-containing protein [Streptococcus equinus]
MNTKTFEQFDVMTEAELSTVEGGVSCFEGVIGVGGLGSTAGPWGLVGGVLVGAAAFCMK